MEVSSNRASHMERLTDREIRVAEAVGAGATNKAVARTLGISIKTVEFHLVNIYRKLGLASRSELANLEGRRASADEETMPPGNLVGVRTPLVGRTEEIDRLSALIGDRAVITVTGCGGVGKTRLAVEAAERARSRFEDGVWVVELGSLAPGADVLAAVTHSFGLRHRSVNPSVEAIAESIAVQRRLLVLDNCEHVLDTAALVAGSVARRCPNVVILATSRERLDIPGEVVLNVPPLDLEGTHPSPAARLFIQRAEEVDSDFALSDDQLDLIDGVCRLVDGIPLAIELAAARVAGFSVPEIHAQMSGGVRPLSRRRPLTKRHQSMDSAIRWSYDLLSPEEREVFEAISYFTGDFDMPSASAVVGAGTLSGVDVCMGSLIEKSLVSATSGPTGRRLRLLQPIREFGLHQLIARNGLDSVRRRHLDRFVAVAVEAKDGLRGGDELRWHHALEADWHNIRVALDTACTLDAGPEACLLVDGVFWWALTRLRSELGEWAGRVLSLSSVAALPMKVVPLAAASYFASMVGDDERAWGAFREAREEERRHGIWYEPWIPVVAPFVVSLDASLEANEETQLRAQASDNLFWETVGLLQEGAVKSFELGHRILDTSDIEDHLDCLRRGSEMAERLGNPNGIAYAAKNLGSALVSLDPERAEMLLLRSLELAEPLALELLAGQARLALAGLFVQSGRLIDAISVLGDSLSSHIRAGVQTEVSHDLAFAVCVLAGLGASSLAALPMGCLLDMDGGTLGLFGLDRLDSELRETLGDVEYGPTVIRGRRIGLDDCAREVLHGIGQLLTRHGHPAC